MNSAKNKKKAVLYGKVPQGNVSLIVFGHFPSADSPPPPKKTTIYPLWWELENKRSFRFIKNKIFLMLKLN
jgi:hypothetical protein